MTALIYLKAFSNWLRLDMIVLTGTNVVHIT